MKKITALILIAVLALTSIVASAAALSPGAEVNPGGLIIPGVKVEDGDPDDPDTPAETEDVVISQEVINQYVDVINVHDASEGSILHEIGKQIKKNEKDKKFDEEKVSEMLGEEYEDQQLIQLFTVETKKDKIKNNQIVLGDFIPQEDGSVVLENIRVVDITDGKIIMRVDVSSVTENSELRLIMNKNGKWVQAEHVRIYNGYITFQLDINEDDGAVFAITSDKKIPTSPPTSDTANLMIPAIVIAVAFLGIAVVTRKYSENR